MHKTAFNSTDGPVVIDAAGRVLGGGEWGTVQTTDPTAKAAIDAGVLVLVDVGDGDDVNPAARAASERTVAIHDRSEALGELDAADLAKLASKAGIEAEGMTKAQLVAALEQRDDVALPASKSAKPAKKEA